MNKLLTMLFVSSFILLAQNKEEIKVKSISKIELEKLIKNRCGKNLLINVWATWCIPCREEFPDLAKMSMEYKDSLDVIAISVDYPDEIDTKIKPFLEMNNVQFPVYISGFDKDEELIHFFSDKWNGALPGTFIYNKSGNQIRFLEGKQSFESFSSIIENL